MKRLLWSILVPSLLFTVVLGSELTGKQLLAQLDSQEQCDRDSAMGYITGYYVGHSGQSMAVDRAFDERLAKAVREHLKKHPEALDQPADTLLHELMDQDGFKRKFPPKALQTEGGSR